MTAADSVFDFLFMLAGIVLTVYVIKKRKHFELRIGILVGITWITKSMRMIAYDFFVMWLKKMSPFYGTVPMQMNAIEGAPSMQFFTILFSIWDLLNRILLLIILLYLIKLRLFTRWYQKVKNKSDA